MDNLIVKVCCAIVVGCIVVIVYAIADAQVCRENMTYQQWVRCTQWQQQRNLSIQRQKSRPHTNKWVERTPSNPGAGKLYFPPSKPKPKYKMIRRSK